jgi:hypothetical protein
VAGFEAIDRLIEPASRQPPRSPRRAGLIGYLGNRLAAQVRTRAGERPIKGYAGEPAQS